MLKFKNIFIIPLHALILKNAQRKVFEVHFWNAFLSHLCACGDAQGFVFFFNPLQKEKWYKLFLTIFSN